METIALVSHFYLVIFETIINKQPKFKTLTNVKKVRIVTMVVKTYLVDIDVTVQLAINSIMIGIFVSVSKQFNFHSIYLFNFDLQI